MASAEEYGLNQRGREGRAADTNRDTLDNWPRALITPGQHNHGVRLSFGSGGLDGEPAA